MALKMNRIFVRMKDSSNLKELMRTRVYTRVLHYLFSQLRFH
jgi:hypothetical protein